MDTSATDNPVSIIISIDEWRDIATWMHTSLNRDEQSANGHFLLECQGTNRTWVTSDGSRTTVIHGEGPPPRGLADPNERLEVLVNSRFFRRGNPQDATLTVTQVGDGRVQTFVTDGVEISLPEHPGVFGDWRSVMNAVAGTAVDVDVAQLQDACAAAAIVPFGIESGDTVYTWIAVRDGKLRLQSPWVDYPSTTIDLPLLSHADDTVPALVAIARLTGLLAAIDVGTCTLRLPAEAMLPIGLQAGRYEAVLLPVDRWGSERQRLEEHLCEFLGVESVTMDDDGDYSVTSPEGYALWVRLHTDSEPVSVQVFSVLAPSVEPSPELFEELNSINCSAAHVKVIWAAGAVMAEVDLVAESLDLAELGNALQVVRDTSEKYRQVLAAFFGSPSDEQEAGEH